MENSELTDEQYQEFRAFCDDFDRTNDVQRAWYFSKGEDLQEFWSNLQWRYTDKAMSHAESKGEASANNDVAEYWKHHYAANKSRDLAKQLGEIALLHIKATAGNSDALNQLFVAFQQTTQATVIRDINGALVAVVVDGRIIWIASLDDLGSVLSSVRGTESQSGIAVKASQRIEVVSAIKIDSLKASQSRAKNRTATIDIDSVKDKVLSWLRGDGKG